MALTEDQDRLEHDWMVEQMATQADKTRLDIEKVRIDMDKLRFDMRMD